MHKSSTDDLLVCVDDGVEGQTVSPTWSEVFKFNSILVSVNNANLVKTLSCWKYEYFSSSTKVHITTKNQPKQSAFNKLNLSKEQKETN